MCVKYDPNIHTYLENLTDEQLLSVYENNKTLQQEVWDRAYDDNMYWMEEDYSNILPEREKGFRYRDNYNSFYLTLEDAYEFAEGLDGIETDYLTNDMLKARDKVLAVYNEYINATDYDKNIYEELEPLAENYLKMAEEHLHKYEDLSDEEAKQYLLDNRENFQEGIYVDLKTNVLYEHIDYVKEMK